MSSTGSSRTSSRRVALAAATLAGCAATSGRDDLPADVMNDFRHWAIEAERPVEVSLRHRVLDIDAPAGVTVWLQHELAGPVRIDFDAVAVSAGGANDQVSDLNVFWMAHEAGDPVPPFARRRSGRFAEYDDLLTYYVGLGGNRNTTTRFRRYVGEPGNRPLLPQHDRADAAALLVPNRWQRITLIANGRHIEYRRDGQPLFVYDDATPYTRGWFALRTTYSHLRVRNVRIRPL
jgi:Domain of unknown function (DUF6250)